jgi:hypothetical protein
VQVNGERSDARVLDDLPPGSILNLGTLTRAEDAQQCRADRCRIALIRPDKIEPASWQRHLTLNHTLSERAAVCQHSRPVNSVRSGIQTNPAGSPQNLLLKFRLADRTRAVVNRAQKQKCAPWTCDFVKKAAVQTQSKNFCRPIAVSTPRDEHRPPQIDTNF